MKNSDEFYSRLRKFAALGVDITYFPVRDDPLVDAKHAAGIVGRLANILG
jgi:hypothetical protein